MDSSIIDLCDSDDDENNDQATETNVAMKKCNADQNRSDDSSSSSSSSDDSHLWNAGGFLKGSPQKVGKEEIKTTRRGNYFKEVRSKYGVDDDGGEKKRMQKKCHGDLGSSNFNSPIISLDVDDEMIEGGAVNYDEDDASSKLAVAVDLSKKYSTTNDDNDSSNNHDRRHDAFLNEEQSNNGRMDKKRQFSSPEKLPNSKTSPSKSPIKKQCKLTNKSAKPVECIEIDLSDSSSDDDDDVTINKKVGVNEKRGDKFNSFAGKIANQHSKLSSKSPNHDRNNDHDHCDVDDSDFDTEFRIQRPAVNPKKVQNPTRKKSAVNPKMMRNIPFKTNTIPTKKKSYESDDDSSHSSENTVSLPEEKMSPAMKEHSKQGFTLERQNEEEEGMVGLTNEKNGKGRVSFNNSDDVSDFSFDNNMDGGFDEDDDQQLPSKANNHCNKESGKEAFAKSMAKPKTPTKPNMSLKHGDREVLDIDSDDDDSSSNSSTELFTPRPFKKKPQKPTATAAAAAYKSEQHQPATTTSIHEEKKCPNSSSKLLTPCAFSPTTTSPTLGTYASLKKQVPTPNIPAMSASLVNEIGGKLYPDLRHNFLVVLTSHARRLRHNSYQRTSFDSALRSVVVISLHMRPLRSAEATRRIKGVGSNFYDLLKESITGPKGKKPFVPAKGKFSCVAAAALVALLELEEATASVASANGMSFPMEDLLRKINQLLDARANASLNQSAEKYLDPDNLDPGWGQIKKLASSNAAADLGGPFLKERKKKDACVSGRVYELLDSGREQARKLRELARLGPAEPGPLRQLPDETVDEEFGNVTMSMDFREGGGGGKSLHKMCDQLDIRGVPYVVRELKIADYIFFVGDKLAPILIERKTTDDVAASLHDGRWERQKISMRKAQWVLGGGAARRCQICYIIEGDANKKKVHGGNVGRRTYFQSVEDVENAIGQLPAQGFSVMKTKGHLDTIGVLAKVAQDVSWKAKNGNIDATITYKQLVTQVKELGEEIGDPPTDREHQNPAPPVVTDAEHIPEASSNPVDDDDNAFIPGNPLDDDNAFVQNNAQSKTSSAPTLQEENSEEYTELKKMPIAKLKEKCKERDEKIGGKKDELIARLLKPRKPEILIMRVRRKEYLPKVPSSNAALMVALLLNHVPGTPGMTKERLMVLAEETGVSKESMSGDGGFYDGWSGTKQLQEGDPALVRREKGHRYSLTTQPPETSGRAVAHALHILAHREGLCTCGNNPE